MGDTAKSAASYIDGPKHLRYSTLYDGAFLISEFVFLVICLLGTITSIRMNGVGRSLWVDEAMLASSFSKRSMLGIISGGEFEYLQSAPLGWILLEKITVKMFGNTEYVLRSWSIVFYVLSLVALFYLSKLTQNSRHSLFGAAVLATTPLILQYSNMFKPYISDCFVALLICCLFVLWLSDGIHTWVLAVLFATLLWCSQPACFIEGGFVLALLLHSLAHHDRKRAASALILGFIICASFAVYYLFWVRRMTSVSTMREWWDGQYLSAVLSSPNKLEKLQEMVIARFSAFGNAGMPVMAGFVYGAIRGWQRQEIVVTGAVLGLLTTCVASLFELYPLNDRLWVFSLPLMLVVMLFGICDLSDITGEIAWPSFGVCALCIALSSSGISTYANPARVYYANEEINAELAQLKQLMSPNDPVYVLLQARPAFEYANGYENQSFGNDSEENVIFGKADYATGNQKRSDDLVFSPQNKPEEDLERILGLDEVWIVCSHLPLSESHQLVDPLLREGQLELASYRYETPLYHWCRITSECLSQAVLEEQRFSANNETTEIRVVNTGQSYLGTPFEDLYLRDLDTGQLFRIGPMIAPGEEASVVVACRKDSSTTFELATATGPVCNDARITIVGSIEEVGATTPS